MMLAVSMSDLWPMLTGLTSLTKTLAQQIGGMSEMGVRDRRYRLSIEAEIIETGEYATTVHTHSRVLEVLDLPDVQSARDYQSRIVQVMAGLRTEAERSRAEASNASQPASDAGEKS